MTATGSVLGTPAFMPPEQAGGQTALIGPRSDVFGLGAILAVVLTGKPPFTSHSVESTRQMAAAGRVDECFARLDGCDADPEWVALCKRCLAPAPADRPADAGEVAKAVGDLRQAADERARQAEQERARAEVRATEQRKRRRVQTALAAAVGLLVVGGGAVAWWQERQASDRRAADLRRQNDDDRRAADEQARLGRNTDAVKGLLDATEAALRAGDTAKAEPLLAEAAKRTDEGGADDQRERITRYRAEVRLLHDLGASDQMRWKKQMYHERYMDELNEQWRAALTAFGVTPDETPPAVAGKRVAEAATRDRLIAEFDLTLYLSKSRWPLEVLRKADPHPFRDAVRSALFAQDWPRMVALFGDPRAADQPVGFVVALCTIPGQTVTDDRGRVVSRAEIPPGRKRELLLQALTRHPNDLGLLMALGWFSSTDPNGTLAERLVWFHAAVAAAPTNAGAWSSLSAALFDWREFARAEVAAREALRLDPAAPAARLNLANALARRGNVDEAVTLCRDVVTASPKDVTGHANLAALLQQKGDLKGAVAVARTAVEHDPQSGHAQANLGVILLDLGDVKGAEAAHRKALELWPEYHHAHLGLGNVLLEKGDVKGAEAEYREAIRLNAKQPDAHFNLGVILRQKGKLADAEACHREAVRLDPNHAPAHSGLGNVLRDKGDLPGALAALKESVRVRPKFAAAHDNLGIVLAMSGDLDGAITAFEEALRLSPNNQGTATNLTKARQMKVAQLAKKYRTGPKVEPAWPRAWR